MNITNHIGKLYKSTSVNTTTETKMPIDSFIGMAARTQKSLKNRIDLYSAKTNEKAQTEYYMHYLSVKYGNVNIQNVGKDQASFDKIGGSTFGTNNVFIAPNIAEEMASNPEKAAYYEEKIQYYFHAAARYQSSLSMMGHELHSCGMVIHEDGTVTHYITGDLKPEVRAKIEARVKAEQEEKAERRRMYAKRSEEAAQNRSEMEKLWQKKAFAEASYDCIIFANPTSSMAVLPQSYVSFV